MRSLNDLRKFVRYMLDEKVETFWEDDELDLFMNLEYNNLVLEIIENQADYYQEFVSLSTTANNRLIPLPSNHAGVVLAVTYDGSPLVYRTKKDFIMTNSGLTENTGEPRRFSIVGNNLWIDPVPKGIHTLELLQTYMPIDMAAIAGSAGPPIVTAVPDTAIYPDMPLGYESLISLGTVLFALLKDKQEMSRIYSLYNARKTRMLASLKSRQTFEPRRVSKR